MLCEANTTLERLDLDDNSISDNGAAAVLSTLQHYNHTLTLVNLDNNSEISPTLQAAINFVLASRRVQISLLKRLDKPLQKGLLPLAIHALRRSSMYREKLEPAHRQETRAGPIFLLVMATFKVIKVTPPCCKRSRTPMSRLIRSERPRVSTN
jgi:Leucine Rich repeat